MESSDIKPQSELDKNKLDESAVAVMESLTSVVESESQSLVELDEKVSIGSNISHSQKFYIPLKDRVFVNRSLHLEKIKFYGFDMDYTLAQYFNPQYEALQFKLIVERLAFIGYPSDVKDFVYDPRYPIRGLWFDKLYGKLLKVDAYGNILCCMHGFKFLKTHEVLKLYPNKFIKLDDSRIYVSNTLYSLPEFNLLAALVDFFTKSPNYISEDIGVKNGDIFMSYTSIFQDVRNCVDWVHMQGALREETVNNLSKYVKSDERLPLFLTRMREAGKKAFLLTNSDYAYTNEIMTYLVDFPSQNKKDWKEYFDYILVDARKPVFFSEGTTLRQVNTDTGTLKIGIHVGPLNPGQVYSGGSSDVFSSLIGAHGKDVLYVGDHIYGDILKSKKTRGWRTFLIVPELHQDVHVLIKERPLLQQLKDLDTQLGLTYREMDCSSIDSPDISQIRQAIRNVMHDVDLCYGAFGSTFRCGSRLTFFANQVCHYADIYASSFANLMHYPFSYLFRAPPMLMPHESTVEQSATSDQGTELDYLLNEPLIRPVRSDNSTSSVPHSFPELPSVVTHHHDTDDEEDTDKSAEN